MAATARFELARDDTYPLDSTRDVAEEGRYARSLMLHRERRALERSERQHRRARLRRVFFVALFVVLAVVSYWRFGDPSALVMLQEGGR